MAQAISLQEELGKAMEEGEPSVAGEPAAAASTESSTPPADKPAEAGKPPAPADRARDETGKFVKAATAEETPAAQDQQAGVPAAQSQEQQPSPVAPAGPADLPPSTWGAAAKAEYAKLPELVRNEIKKRETDFQKGIGQYKQAADAGTQLLQAVGPQAQALQTQYGSIANGIKTLLDISNFASTKPQDFIMWFAQQRGINLNAPQTAAQSQTAEPGAVNSQALAQTVQQLVQPYMQQLSQFQSQFQTAQQQAEQTQLQEISGQLEAFRTATDEKGAARHMYYDNVRGIMAALIQNGDAGNLEQAYEMAIRAHPEVSSTIQAEQHRSIEARQLEEARRKADEAKRAAGANVSGQGGVGLADTSKRSLHDDLAAAFEGRL